MSKVKLLMDDTHLLLVFRKTIREEAREDPNTEGLIRLLDSLVTHFIAVTVKTLVQVEKLDSEREKSAN